MTTDEMRVRCAEEMGWDFHAYDNSHGGKFIPVRRGTWLGYVPAYDSDLNAAITLCDKLAEEGFYWSLENHPDGYFCAFAKMGMERVASHTAPTLAEAICGAFLKVRGVEIEREES